MAKQAAEKPETTTAPALGKESASATTTVPPETPISKALAPEPERALDEDEDGAHRRDLPGCIGRSLAHLERIQGGPILALVVQNLARDLVHDGSPEDDEFEIIEAMLQELEQHDNLAHLAAARKALAQ